MLKMRYVALILIIIVSMYACLSEPEAPIVIGDISGTVLDAETFLAIPGVTISTNPATSTVTSGTDGNFQLNDLAEGDYTLTASRTGYNSASSEISVIADRVVNADIQLNPLASILVVNTSELNFGTNTSNLNLQIQNTGYGTLSWTVSKNQPWLTVTPSSGSTETETDLINVAVDRTGYNPGNYSDIISIITNSNAASISALMVVPNTEGPQLTIAPDSYDFGTSESSHQFVVSNSGIGTLEWAAISNTSWLSMDVTSGSLESGTNIITVTVDRFELQAGDYSGNISVSSNGGNQLITVSASVSTTSELIVSTSELDFGNTYGELQVVLSNSTDIPLSWQAVPAQTWISVNPALGIIETTPMVATITVNREALAIGSYTGAVDFIYAGGIATVGVLLNVTSVPLDNPVLQITGQTGNSVSLGWTRPLNSTSFQRYDVRRASEPGVTEESPIIASNTTYADNSYTDSGLALGQTFYYRVYAVNLDGYGSPSNEIVYTTDSAIPGTWVVQSELDNYDAWAGISMISTSLGYVLKAYNGVYELAGNEWSDIGGWSDNYYRSKDFEVVSQNNIWVCGSKYRIRKYNGIEWTLLNDDGSNSDYSFYDIAYLSENSVWFGGGYYYSSGSSNNDPRILHWNGEDFDSYTLNDGVGYVSSLFFVSENDGYALTEQGQVYRWNGLGWSVHTLLEDMPGTGSYYNKIIVLTDGTMFVSRSTKWYDSETQLHHSVLYRYDGSQWAVIQTPMEGHNDFVIFESDAGWSVGNYGQILFTGNGGGTWQPVTSPTDVNIYHMDWIDENNGWALGNGGVVLRYSN